MRDALKALTALRMAGKKPSQVLIYAGDWKQEPWWRYENSNVSVTIKGDESLRNFDARPLVGCDVVLIGDREQRTKEIVAKLCEHVSSVATLTTTNADDLGHVWERGLGWRKFGG